MFRRVHLYAHDDDDDDNGNNHANKKITERTWERASGRAQNQQNKTHKTPERWLGQMKLFLLHFIGLNV